MTQCMLMYVKHCIDHSNYLKKTFSPRYR